MNFNHPNKSSSDHNNLFELHKQGDGNIYKFNLDEAIVLAKNEVQEALKSKNVKMLSQLHEKLCKTSNGVMLVAKIISEYFIEEVTKIYISSKFDVNQEKELYNLLLENMLTYFQIYDKVFAKSECYQELMYSYSKNFLQANLISDNILSDCIDETVKKHFNGEKTNWQNKVRHTISLVTDKDNFIEAYKQRLSSRLLDNLSDGKVEKWAVCELKKQATFYTIDLEKLFDDLKVSEVLSNDFKNKNKQNYEVLRTYEAEFRALYKYNWHVSDNSNCNLPTAMRDKYDSFKRCYESKSRGKVMNLQHSECHAEVYFYAQNQENNKIVRKTIKLNNYQLSVLILFNDQDFWAVKDIELVTGISQNFLVKVLESLCFPPNSEGILKRFSNKHRERNFFPTDLMAVNDTLKTIQDGETPISFPMSDFEDKKCQVDLESLKTLILRIVMENENVDQKKLIERVLKGRFKDEVSAEDVNHEIAYLTDLGFVSRNVSEGGAVSYRFVVVLF